eukprot:TRINITY_DN5329_c0_g1_i1.p1 TRINITY_DN5329_c0_g1~~TRINITY_DN5329_c0_g1_i1.p1  ORF type:complete len:365 (-),score=45.33 TRINITY_DN5329_c0_g1_i1:37-1131(-)
MRYYWLLLSLACALVNGSSLIATLEQTLPDAITVQWSFDASDQIFCQDFANWTISIIGNNLNTTKDLTDCFANNSHQQEFDNLTLGDYTVNLYESTISGNQTDHYFNLQTSVSLPSPLTLVTATSPISRRVLVTWNPQCHKFFNVYLISIYSTQGDLIKQTTVDDCSIGEKYLDSIPPTEIEAEIQLIWNIGGVNVNSTSRSSKIQVVCHADPPTSIQSNSVSSNSFKLIWSKGSNGCELCGSTFLGWNVSTSNSGDSSFSCIYPVYNSSDLFHLTCVSSIPGSIQVQTKCNSNNYDSPYSSFVAYSLRSSTGTKPSSNKGSGSSLSPGAIAGIVIGVLAGVGLCLVLMLVKRRSRSNLDCSGC